MAQYCGKEYAVPMIHRANSLTERVRRRAASRPIAMTMSAHDARVFVEGLERLGYDKRRILSSAEILESQLKDPDARFTTTTIGGLLAAALRDRFTPNLALELARVTPFGAWPLLDYLVLTAETVGAGVEQLVRYLRITNAPVTFAVREDPDSVQVEVTSPLPFAIEYEIALVAFHFCNETEGRFIPDAVHIQHALVDRDAFERGIGCETRSNSSWNGIRISKAAWRLPLRRRDAVLRQVLEQQARELLERLPAREGLAFEVQRTLTARVAGGDTRMSSLAASFAMSPRTLQRKLALEGVSYQALLEFARKEAAGKYLATSALAIGEIAYLLGYSEPAPFHRAFKRWYRMTPEAYRGNKRR